MFPLFCSCLLLSLGVYSVIFGMEINRDPSVDLATILNHVSQLEAGLRATMTELQETKDRLEAHLQEKQQHFSSTNSSLSFEMQALKMEFVKTKAELETANARLREEEQHSSSMNRSLTAEIQAIKTDLAMKTKHIAFNTFLAHDMNTGPNVSLKFDAVLYNAGNGYNNRTGMFTAPVSGIYMFSTQVVMHDSPGSAFVQILKSGSILSEGYGGLTKDYDYITIPATAIAYVRQEEQVWVVSYKDVHLTGFKSSTFAGALLSTY